jgi:phosphatidate cytidylyltransferase
MHGARRTAPHIGELMVREHAIWLTTAIACVLLIASVIGVWLKYHRAQGQPHAVIDNLNARIRSWWVMAAVLGGALWAGMLATFGLFAMVSLIALREYTKAAPASRAFTWLTGLGICVICIAHIPALLTLDIPGYGGRNVFLLVFLVLITQASDVLQYLWGKWLGKHPIAPRISPSKTVEGFLGGIICATLMGTSLWWITPFSMLQATAVSLMITLLGFAGGLILSAQKRARGIKDWGDLIRGHGGMLDRIDSLWLSAPAFYCLVRIGWGD